ALIHLYTTSGQEAQALAELQVLGRIQKQIIRRGALHLSEHELAAYTASFSDYFHSHFTILEGIEPPPGPATEAAYDDVLFYKGFLLANTSRVRRLVIEDPTLAEKQEQLSQVQTRLSAEYAKPPAAREGLDALEAEANRLEKVLVTSVARYGAAYQQVAWQAVQQALQAGEAALEFVRFAALEDDLRGDFQYAALLILPGNGSPLFIPLFSEEALQQVLNPVSGQRIERINQLYAWSGAQSPSLFQLIWQPLAAQLEGISTIYFSPDGILHRLNLNAIATDAQQVLGEQFRLVRLSSTRQLAFEVGTTASDHTAALFGGIEYDPEQESRNQGPGAARKRGTGREGSGLRLRGEDWSYLDWTKTEIETIGLLTEAAGLATTSFTGHAATEEVFKAFGGSKGGPQLLHLATHGYFFPTPDQEQERNAFEASQHPMIRSGLILANGNYAWKNGEPIAAGVDDGILTAYEIAQLDLHQTELVTLSACETGLGEIKDIEGVFGLQRAFKLAGVRYIVMSLWQIPDFQTQEFMTAFYFNYLDQGMPIPTAFRRAQLELRKRYPDPFLWAGFVLME
ncbi:MAG: CHAT domain-containing protein, partial [Phaeodactylibacter sp.]|nr:CHAT domain-containing protein [Phaeodactylibacter sp.]